MSSKISKILTSMGKKNFFTKLIETDSGVSSKSFFLVATTITGILLLLVPAIVLLVEVYYNHTIQTDLSGLSSYIGAVAAMFASAGLTKAWSEWSENKYVKRNQNTDDKENSKSISETKE